MPVICRFYGVVIMMYFNDHNPPHCHVKYAQFKAIFGFDGGLIEGELPSRATKFVQEWISVHRLELEINWRNARSGLPLQAIAPLD